MSERRAARASTTGGLPVAPALGTMLESTSVEPGAGAVDRRVLWISALAVVVAAAAGVVAKVLMWLIGLITNLSFFGRWSADFSSPAGNHLGWWVVAVPVLGGIVVGLMARYGSAGIRGHGIPEAMEQILTNQSRVPARLTVLKPISAAISIGTGGPFGAEGPIIATGGALGSLVGQLLKTTAAERKTLLAAGAAAGMAATFGSPVSSVLLAVELLLFEYRARSVIPVALAAATATGVRMAFMGTAPVFPMPDIAEPGAAALAVYVVLGAIVGLFSVWVTEAVYWIEDQFERIPVHWMWWPAIGAVAVGVIGYISPHTLGVGYDNITAILSGSVVGWALVSLFVLKFVSWAVSLGSGTSGGTLAPLFTIGGGLGVAVGALVAAAAPGLGVDPRIAGLVGMAAMFAGASRAFLASVIFAFEATRQPLGLLPLLGGGAAAFLISWMLMRDTIMTKKITRRGVRVIGDYGVDVLEQFSVTDWMTRDPVTLRHDRTVRDVREWLGSGAPGSSHQGFPVVDGAGDLVGVITRRDLLDAAPEATLASLVRRTPVVVQAHRSLREAADLMAVSGVGRLPVVAAEAPRRPVGIITRSDLLGARTRRIEEVSRAEQSVVLRRIWAD